MKGELHHALHPRHTYMRWAIFYVIGVAVAASVFFVVTNRIRTYSIPSGALQLSVPYKKYLVGETISFTLRNNYNSPVYVEDECPAEPLIVYKQTGDDWVRIHDKATTASCIGKERRISIAPYSKQSGTFDAWPNLFKDPGTYRIVAHVDYFNAAPYEDFEVIAKPEVKVATPTTVSVATVHDDAETTQTIEKTNSPASTAVIAPVVTVPTLNSKTITLTGGSISVQYSSTFITVISVTPAAGCTKEGGRSGAQVQVQFNCGRSETQIVLSLVNGQLTWHTQN